MAAKTIPVEQAVGMVLPHDITEIILASDSEHQEFKGARFRKGHIIQQEDIIPLKKLGKDNIYILTLGPDEIHENEAAEIMAQALIGSGVEISGEPTEGKLSLVASYDGLLKVDVDKLYDFNYLGEVMCSTLHNNTPVTKGTQVGATRLIPLTSKRSIVEKAASIVTGSILAVSKLRKAKAGLIITGNEVFHGRIKDAFEPVLREKLGKLGSEVVHVAFAPDDIEIIAREINNCIDKHDADLIITSGGMSVDPDDVTRMAIAKAGTENIVYGSPVLPGAMFLSGNIGQIPVLGLPACGMFHRITIFDLIIPRVLTGEKITREDFAKMGHGGLCSTCKVCTYPICHFGK